VVRELSRVSTDPQMADFPEAKQFLKSRNRTTHKNAPSAPGKPDHEELSRHFVSSLDEHRADSKRLAQIIQSHWCCESRHWQRDACWHEDKCLIRKPNAACALALIRATLQSLVRWAGRHSLPSTFEDVSHDLSLGLGWIKSRNLHT
jgi:predicted transposase YbfD/YdcC